MQPTTVLVGFAEAISAPEVIWSLLDQGYSVVAFARKGRPSALRHSRHVVCHEICPPEANIENSLSDLQTLLDSIGNEERETPRVLFPLDDKAVWLGSRVNLRNRWILAGPSGTNAELALNKCLQIQRARDAGFNVPRTTLARNASDVAAFAAQESFPVILKAAECVPIRDGRVQSCRKWICADSNELNRAVEEWAERVPLLVQPFIEGVGEGVFGLAAPEGVRAWSAHRRVRMMNPQGSGSSACVSQPVSQDLRDKSHRLIQMAGWRGIFMVELLRDSAGKAWFVELNGRPWGSTALSRRQGLEYPAWNVDLAIDDLSRVGEASSTTDGMICRHIGREFMHLLFVARGARSKAQRSWPSFWKALTGVVRLHRGDSYYNWRRDDAKVFVADCYYTIHDNIFKSRN